jgi:ATP-dependent DNA ligase
MPLSIPIDRAVPLPYAKYKKGMRVLVNYADRDTDTAVIIEKVNATKSLKVRIEDTGVVLELPLSEVFGQLSPDPFDQIHPMLAKNIEDYANLDLDDLLRSDEWVAERKYDGERQLLTFWPGINPDFDRDEFITTGADKGNVGFRATTRVIGKHSGRLAANSYHIQHMAEWPVPMDGVTVFDVELDHEGGFRAMRSIMGSSYAEALRKQDEQGLVFAWLLDCLWFNGRDLRGLPYEQRRAVLDTWYSEARQHLLDQGGIAGMWKGFAKSAKRSPIARTEEEKRALLQRSQTERWEGIMLKRLTAPYTDTTLPGRRSADLLKVKPFSEADVIVTGFEMGKGMYNTEVVGAITFAQWVPINQLTPKMEKNIVGNPTELVDDALSMIPTHALVHMGSCSGFTQEQARLFTERPIDYIGEPMMVTFQQRWPDSGLMRHPCFIRMRISEKNPSDCVYDAA